MGIYKIKKKNLDIGGETNMATQIAATPILYGKEAEKVMKEAKMPQTKKAKENAIKLMDFFNKFTK